MGATALMRLDEENEIKVQANKLDIPIHFIKNLPKRLFDYMIKTYSRGQNALNWLNKIIVYAKNNSEENTPKQKETYKNAMKQFMATLKDSLDKVEKYFVDEALKIVSLKENFQVAFEEKNFEKIAIALEELQTLLLRDDINEKITLNYTKAVILAPASGQVSFLNVTKNTLTRAEQEALFYKDFIEPILTEERLRNLLNKNDDEQILSFLRESEYIIAKEWRKEHKKSKSLNLQWFNDYPTCSALITEWGTLPFEEKMFMPLGSTSLNDRWDGQEANIQFISAFARLLLFLSPLGCSRYKKKTENYDENVFAYLHIEGDCLQSFERNNRFDAIMRGENSFVEALKGTHEKQAKIEEEKRASTTLVEWFTDSKAKKTLLEYRWIEGRFYQHILKNPSIDKISPINFREALVQQHLRNYDTKTIILDQLFEQLNLSTIRNTYSIKQALKIRELMIGGNEMDGEKTLTDRMYGIGNSLRYALTAGDNVEVPVAQYKASNSKKLDSAIYRILNAAKSGNRQLFFELVIRLHLSAGRKVSKEFTQCLDREITNDAKFSTMSLAFIAGLMGVDTNKGEKKDGENN